MDEKTYRSKVQSILTSLEDDAVEFIASLPQIADQLDGVESIDLEVHYNGFAERFPINAYFMDNDRTQLGQAVYFPKQFDNLLTPEDSQQFLDNGVETLEISVELLMDWMVSTVQKHVGTIGTDYKGKYTLTIMPHDDIEQTVLIEK